jgi:hypothetical protein
LTRKKYEKFHKQNKSAVVKYCLTFIIILVDLISYLIGFNVGGISKTEENDKIDVENDKPNTWILMLPILTMWAITLGFYIHLKKRKGTIKKKIKNLILERKGSIKCYTKGRAAQFRNTLKLHEKNFSDTYFENFLFSVLLYLFPILLKLIFFKNLGFKIIFCITAVLYYGYDILHEIIKFFYVLKQKRKYNKEFLIDSKNSYKSINVVVDNMNNTMNLNEDNNVIIGEKEINFNTMNENAIYERNKKMKSKLSGMFLNISFVFVKIVLEILFIIYLTRIGEKFDDPNSSCSWSILFIPVYLCSLPIILFCILHCLSLYRIFKGKVLFPILTVIPCMLTFIVNSVMIPLKLDKKISLHQSFIPIIFTIGTIFLIIHLIILRNYKKLER